MYRDIRNRDIKMEFILYSWRQSVSETTEKLKYRFHRKPCSRLIRIHEAYRHCTCTWIHDHYNYLNSEYMYIQSFIIGGNPPCSGTYDFLKLKVLIYKIIFIHQ